MHTVFKAQLKNANLKLKEHYNNEYDFKYFIGIGILVYIFKCVISYIISLFSTTNYWSFNNLTSNISLKWWTCTPKYVNLTHWPVRHVESNQLMIMYWLMYTYAACFTVQTLFLNDFSFLSLSLLIYDANE